jgi:outer membrane protein assembly factor BamB
MSGMRPWGTAAALASAALLTLSARERPRAQASGDDVRMIAVEGEGERYWPRWRGPSAQGLVAGSAYPDAWSETENVKWKASVPGRGNSSPIVWGDRIFLTTAYEEGRRLSLLCYRRSDGARLWETFVPQEGVEHVHQKNGHASATPVTDGERVYASFGTHGLAAVDLNGKLVWHRNLGTLNNYHGSAGSPVLHQGRIYLYQDHRGSDSLKSFVAAFDARTGKTVWWKDRTATTGWGTPVLVQVGERAELVVSSQHEVNAYDPKDGAELWRVRGNKFEVIPTPVVAHGLVFCSSGRAGPTFAIRPGGTGDVTETHVVWQTSKGSPFVPSGIVYGEQLYLVNDMMSIITAYEAKSGRLLYQERLGEAMREGFSASPVAVDGKIFFTNDHGETFVVKAGPAFTLLRVNPLNARVLASPALVEGRWYFRTESELLAIGRS